VSSGELARTSTSAEELDNALWCAAHGGPDAPTALRRRSSTIRG